MYYLTDTWPQNGCLRVIPGSYRRKHHLHNVNQTHTAALSRVGDPNNPLYGLLAEEKSVPVRVGDLAIGDSRLLHSVHVNQSSEYRNLITLWHHPNFGLLLTAIQVKSSPNLWTS